MDKIIDIVLKGITVAMGVAVTVLSVIGHLDAHTGLSLLGLGLTSAGILQIRK